MTRRRRRNDAFLIRTRRDGSREASGTMWFLIWILPVLFAVAAIGLTAQTLYLQAVTVETTGTVVRVYEWDSDNPFDEGPKVYGPVFRYTWTDGKPTEATAGVSSSLWNFPIGTERPIRYHPGSKENIIVVGPSEWLVARVIAILTILTAIPALIASFVLRGWLRRGWRPPTEESSS